MKNLNNLKNYVLRTTCWALIIFVLAACSEKAIDPYENGGEEEEFTGLIVNLSTDRALESFGAAPGTRAYDTSQEANMTNLYIVAADPYGYLSIFTMNPPSNNLIGQETQYKINLNPGKYRFYAFSNLDLYLDRVDKVSGFRMEEQLKQIVLNYSADTPISPGHIPMACLPEQIVIREEGGYKAPIDGGNYVTIEVGRGGQTHIVAELAFLCSKVRYTILFDSEEGGISTDFGHQSIRFMVSDAAVNPFATRIRKQTKLYLGTTHIPGYDTQYKKIQRKTYFTDEDIESGAYNDRPDAVTGATKEHVDAHWNLQLDRYRFPMKNGQPNLSYPESGADELTMWNEDTDGTWTSSRRKAWQGVVYLPENNANDVDDAADSKFFSTRIEFPYLNGRFNPDGTLDLATEEQAPDNKVIYLFGYNDTHEGVVPLPNKDHNLVRGYYYDIVAKVKTPDYMEVEMKVAAKPWLYQETYVEW